MPSLNAWLADSEAIAAEPRAVAAWRRIQDKPSSIAFKTPAGTILAAQTVRVEYDSGASESESESGPAAARKLTVFGVKDHPTVDDTVIASGYRFVTGGNEYTVMDVIEQIGEVQARAERIS